MSRRIARTVFPLRLYRSFHGKADGLSESDSSTFDDLVKQSTVIFKGTVTHPRNNGLVRVDSTEETAVVHVDTVYYLRGSGMKLDGQDIALKAQEVREADVGKPMVFFA